MKKINVIMHYPKDELAAEYIMEVTTQTYLRSVIKVIDKSSLTINEKKELLIKKIDMYIK
jgi:hypothetical protein